jgi:hypothetical protein
MGHQILMRNQPQSTLSVLSSAREMLDKLCAIDSYSLKSQNDTPADKFTLSGRIRCIWVFGNTGKPLVLDQAPNPKKNLSYPAVTLLSCLDIFDLVLLEFSKSIFHNLVIKVGDILA